MTKATFRLLGNDLDPAILSTEFNIVPSSSHMAGEHPPRQPGRTYPTGVWTLDSNLDENASLAEHLEWLLSTLAGC
jgi:hypothetical protein